MNTTHRTRTRRYHERSGRACDECKLRKRRCEGTEPCHNCMLEGRQCLFSLTTKAYKPATQQIRELERKLRHAKSLLEQAKSGADPDLCEAIDRFDGEALSEHYDACPSKELTPSAFHLTSMMKRRGYLPYGPCSGPAICASLLDFFDGPQALTITDRLTEVFDRPFLHQDVLLQNVHCPEYTHLERRTLVQTVLTSSHPFLHFLQPKNERNALSSLYESDTTKDTNADHDLALTLQMLLALGLLLNRSSHRSSSCEQRLQEALARFSLVTSRFEITTCRNIEQLRTLTLMLVYLIFTSRLNCAIGYLSLAFTAICRTTTSCVSYSEYEGAADEIKQVHSTLLLLDNYLYCILGFRATTNQVTGTKHGPNSDTAREKSDSRNLISEYEELVHLTAGVLHDFSDSALSMDQASVTVLVNKAPLRDLESSWTKARKPPELPMNPDPSVTHSYGSPDSPDLALCWSKLHSYWPFLHYLQPLSRGQTLSDHVIRPALACLKVAVTTIVTAETLLEQSKVSQQCWLSSADWTFSYTVLLAVLVLIFLISIHDGTSKPSEAWRKAETGLKILAALRCGDSGASSCLRLVREVIRQLKHTVNFDIDGIEETAVPICQLLQRASNNQMSVDCGEDGSTTSEVEGEIGSPTASLGNSMSTADAMLTRAKDLFPVDI